MAQPFTSDPAVSSDDGGTGFTKRAPADGPRALPGIEAGEHYRPLVPRRGGESLANFLGWFSVGLGLSQLVAPESVAKLIGVKPTTRVRSGMRALGARELSAGLGILSGQRQGDWLWSRVAGDTMDIALLARAMQTGRDPGRTGAALAAVVGVTLLDVLAAQQVSKRTGSLFQTRGSDDGRRPGSGEGDDFESASEHMAHGDFGSRGINTARGIARGPADVPESKRGEKSLQRTSKVVTIGKSPEELYRFWRNFENLPQFMRHLVSVESTDRTHSRWTAMAPAGKTVSWDAEITEDRPNELIAWRSLPGADVRNAGTVRFSPAPGGRGTEVRVDLEYRPPAGKLGTAIAMLFHSEPSQQVLEDLRHFKQVMELGEITLSDSTTRSGFQPAQPSDKPVELKV